MLEYKENPKGTYLIQHFFHLHLTLTFSTQLSLSSVCFQNFTLIISTSIFARKVDEQIL